MMRDSPVPPNAQTLMSPRLAEGSRLGDRYEIGLLIGRGGMAEVYEAQDLVLGRRVAVKVLREPLAADRSVEDSFIREAHAAASLAHPNIVALHDAGWEGQVPFIVMEFVPGETLSALIAREGRLDPERATEIAEGMAEALADAHDRGIVHRDVKPANVMVTPAGLVKMLDFGIARALGWSPLHDDTRIHGTAEYLSPEQARGDPLDGRSDVYSLGVVLFEMLAGAPPFTDALPTVIARRHIDDPPPLGMLSAAVPGALCAMMARCLEKDPKARYQSARQLARDLRRLRSDRRGVTAPLPRVRTTDPLEPVGDGGTSWIAHQRSRHGGVIGVAAAVAALLVATVVWLVVVAGGKEPAAAPKPRPQPLVPPTGLRAAGACDGLLTARVALSWRPSQTRHADGYAVYRAEAPDGPFRKVELLTGGDSASYVDTGLGTSTRYYYVIQATSGSHLSAYSAPAQARTPTICLF